MKTGISFEANLSRTNEVAKAFVSSAITKHTSGNGKETSFMDMDLTFQRKGILLRATSVVQSKLHIK